MHIGHINLCKSMNGTGEHFVKLVEALNRHGIRQHVIVRNAALARRLSVYDNVSVGPTAKTPVMAYCLMPQVNVAHAHDDAGGHAGLLLTLTRTIPYVLTRRERQPLGRNPITRSVHTRASSLICTSEDVSAILQRENLATPIDVIPDISYLDDEGLDDENHEIVSNRAASEHTRIYRRVLDSWRVPALLL